MEAGTMEVKELIRKEMEDWEDEEVSRAWFKAFSSQKSNWEPTYHFRNHLLFSIARAFPHSHPFTFPGTPFISLSLSLSLSLSQFIVSDYLGFFFFFKGEEQLVQSQWIDPFG